MPAVSKQATCRATNIADLNAIANDIPRMTDARKFLRVAENAFKKAEQYNMVGDEESAYIMYMRYFDIIKAIKTSLDYKKNKKFFNEMIGVRRSQRAIEEAEKLSKSLQDRYDEIEAEEVSKRFEARLLREEEAKLEENQKKEPSKKDEKTKREETDKMDVEASENTTQNGVPNRELGLSVQSLYALLRGSESILIMDVRPEEQFAASHIVHRQCINVPADILPPGSTVNYIEKALPKDSLPLWQERNTMDHIVMLDWRCSEATLKPGTTLASLKDALWKWDAYNKLNSEPVVLTGGYDEWLTYYPTLSTNANVTRPSWVFSGSSPDYSLDNITYEFDQAFLDSPEKDDKSKLAQLKQELEDADSDQMADLVPVPSVDRSLKPSADLNNIRGEQQHHQQQQQEQRKHHHHDHNYHHPKQQQKQKQQQQPAVASGSGGPGSAGQNGRASDNLEMINNQLGKDMKINGDKLVKRLLRNDGGDKASKPNLKVNNVPSVNRTLKPALDSAEGSALARADHEAALGARLESQRLLDAYRTETRGLVKERRARIAALRGEESQLRDVQRLKRRELEETADVMRLKRRIQAELDEMEAEKSRAEKESAARQEEFDKLVFDENQKLHLRQESERLQDLKHPIQSTSTGTTTHSHEILERNMVTLQEGKVNMWQEEQDLEFQDVDHRRKEQERQEELEEQERRVTEAESQERLELEKAAKERHREQERQAEIKRLNREHTDREWIERENRLAANREGVKSGTSVGRPLSRDPITGAFTPPGSPRRVVSSNSRVGVPTTRSAASGIVPGLAPITPDNHGLYKSALRDADDKPRSNGMRRSHSSPNIAQLVQDEEELEPLQPSFPNVDRGSKPRSPRPERQMVPAKSEVSAAKVRNLQPTWGNVGRGLTGLRNLGNTCYMNSTIQCLSNTSFLTTYFLTDNYRLDINRDNVLGKKGEVAEEFAVLIKALWTGQYRAINPRDFKGVISKYHSVFAGYDQQDSQEMLLFLLDCLHEDLNKVKKRPKHVEVENDGVPEKIAAERAWLSHKQVNNSIIVDLFQGQFMSTLTCIKCEKMSTTFDTFMYLTVPIPSNTRCSLRDCLMHFAKEEKMTGDSQWSCPRCKCRRDAMKRIVIYRLPRILLIHLKRFYYQGMWRQKINATIDFQLENLDLNKYVEGPEKQNPYNLYAVSNHYGTMEGGHYTAFCKSPSNGRWHKYDDHEVYDLPRQEIKSPAAYILYYTNITQDLQFTT